MKRFLPLFLLTLTAIPNIFASPHRPLRSLRNIFVPIFDVKSGYLLGGSRNGKWMDAKTTALTLKNASNFRVFGAIGPLGTARATLPKSEGAPCPDTLFSKMSPDFSRHNAEFALGGAHNPLRRAYRAENTNQRLYRNLVAGILKRNGIARPIVQILQIWRVDLDGDGTQEVLLTAARKDDEGDPTRIGAASRAGDYSLLLLRQIVGGKVRNIIIEGSFYPRAKEFNAPGFTRLAAVLDADGDGKMEFLVRGAYYEGHWTTLYSVQGAKPREVLSEGCGA